MKEQQIEDRIWKIDQQNECLIIKLMLLNSVKDRLVKPLQRVHLKQNNIKFYRINKLWLHYFGCYNDRSLL
jgi:hypothetical protein